MISKIFFNLLKNLSVKVFESWTVPQKQGMNQNIIKFHKFVLCQVSVTCSVWEKDTFERAFNHCFFFLILFCLGIFVAKFEPLTPSSLGDRAYFWSMIPKTLGIFFIENDNYLKSVTNILWLFDALWFRIILRSKGGLLPIVRSRGPSSLLLHSSIAYLFK